MVAMICVDCRLCQAFSIGSQHIPNWLYFTHCCVCVCVHVRERSLSQWELLFLHLFIPFVHTNYTVICAEQMQYVQCSCRALIDRLDVSDSIVPILRSDFEVTVREKVPAVHWIPQMMAVLMKMEALHAIKNRSRLARDTRDTYSNEGEIWQREQGQKNNKQDLNFVQILHIEWSRMHAYLCEWIIIFDVFAHFYVAKAPKGMWTWK